MTPPTMAPTLVAGVLLLPPPPPPHALTQADVTAEAETLPGVKPPTCSHDEETEPVTTAAVSDPRAACVEAKLVLKVRMVATTVVAVLCRWRACAAGSVIATAAAAAASATAAGRSWRSKDDESNGAPGQGRLLYEFGPKLWLNSTILPPGAFCMLDTKMKFVGTPAVLASRQVYALAFQSAKLVCAKTGDMSTVAVKTLKPEGDGERDAGEAAMALLTDGDTLGDTLRDTGDLDTLGDGELVDVVVGVVGGGM